MAVDEWGKSVWESYGRVWMVELVFVLVGAIKSFQSCMQGGVVYF